jgi:uncharacterized protein YlxW (UPF0749 family)
LENRMSIEDEVKKLLPNADQRSGAPRVFILNADMKDCGAFRLVDQTGIHHYAHHKLIAIVLVTSSQAMQVPDYEQHKKSIASGYTNSYIPTISVPVIADVPMFLFAESRDQTMNDMRNEADQARREKDAVDSQKHELERKLTQVEEAKFKVASELETAIRLIENLKSFQEKAGKLQTDLEKLQHHYGQAAIKEITGKK